MLDTGRGRGEGVLQVFKLKGTRNEINRNDSTNLHFYFEKKHNSCNCVHNLILSY